jgi:hypothetical protein
MAVLLQNSALPGVREGNHVANVRNASDENGQPFERRAERVRMVAPLRAKIRQLQKKNLSFVLWSETLGRRRCLLIFSIHDKNFRFPAQTPG